MTKTDPANDTAPASRPAAPLRARGRSAWVVETAVIFAVILALDAAMRPGFALLEASPHVFWIAVLAVAASHGLPAGLLAAAVATGLFWWSAPGLSPALADPFAQAAHLWREPVLWLLAALLLGGQHDRQARRRDEAESRAAEAEARGEAIAAYAGTLRDHIARLEQALASAPETEAAEPSRDDATETDGARVVAFRRSAAPARPERRT